MMQNAYVPSDPKEELKAMLRFMSRNAMFTDALNEFSREQSLAEADGISQNATLTQAEKAILLRVAQDPTDWWDVWDDEKDPLESLYAKGLVAFEIGDEIQFHATEAGEQLIEKFIAAGWKGIEIPGQEELIYALCDLISRQMQCRLEALALNDDRLCRQHISLQFPIIQGTRMQQMVKALGQRPKGTSEDRGTTIKRLTDSNNGGEER
ncbi:hypothetical protein D0962_23000 [Leptolyngbyaceae cyanobacterium CCMR0082]|uniref:Uncharacterized protein n=1 Tax=Adonisia turfae CCMR0082 TaxID=2304604 RepID=A0A6M0SAQ9_9CYAN|nr:hypothetical protein [Adonisia turfae]NEZ65588.1 hypothetical protein [Adonisia turfae CCMR0082]